MNKANKNVVAVAREGDTTEHSTGNPETGVLPNTSQAKKVKLWNSALTNKQVAALYKSEK
ncbi:MAG TPA: hypothetical protein DCZ23_06895 [Lachnospiraceae bacterium]|nr:hypothetical protein [Lachnospiraceae bacterium]